MTDDFVDGDVFDPEVASKAEEAQYERIDNEDEAVKAHLETRKRNYMEVFSEGATSQTAIDFVMNDLGHFCRAHTSTFHPTNSKVQDLLEGRKEVHQRIVDNTCLDRDTLFVKYTNAQQS